MRKSQVLGVIVGVATASSIGVANAQTAAPITAAPTAKVVGIIDRDRVVANYPKAQSAAEELKRMEEKLNKVIDDANRQYEEAKKANKPPAELEGLQKRLQANIDEEGKRFQARISGMEADLETNVDAAIKAEAAQHHVDVVFLKQAVLFGGVDLTNGVLQRLVGANAAASAAKGPATK
ncbi:MAG TPA: OmpH family outer membrane protein [Candidatus Obscuribacterales bacterium]